MYTDPINLELEARRSLQRMLPRLEAQLAGQITTAPQIWADFRKRLEAQLPTLFALYHHLYARRYDFFYHFENLLQALAQAAFERSPDLRALDQEREARPDWFQSNQMVGGVCYVDLFAGNLAGLRNQIPYFKELGLTYLHLMPLFKMPAGENDGGYAVSSFREVDAPLGSMAELAGLAQELRAQGISLVLDLIINHTSNEHEWVQRARAGDPEYREIYGIFPDRTVPDAYGRHLRDIFPDEHPGAFTWDEGLQSWIWTTFHSYQWDLNYANPMVFNKMAAELLFLANQGIEIFRLDAVAFIWKELGTGCENLPEAHLILQGFNALTRIAAPAVLFKSEAIVHPDDVVKYISPQECQLSYNPLLMALLWNTLATRNVNLLAQALASRFKLPPGTAWVNYVRCHDDIGWTFADDDAARLNINGHDHRQFLNEFYRGRFPGSFARGLPFQENPRTRDCRISGTCASLAGLEKALAEEGPAEVDLAIRRIALIYSLVMTAGGVPLIYLGDEIGTLNDYSYLDHPDHKRDSRWVHRPRASREQYARRSNPAEVAGRVYRHFQEVIALRKATAALSGGELEVIDAENEHVLCFSRTSHDQRVVIFANFTEVEQTIAPKILQQNHLLQKPMRHGSGRLGADGSLTLPPLAFVLLG